MRKLERFANAIDVLSTFSGKVSAFALVALVAIVNAGVIARRILGAPIAWGFDVSYMLWGFLFIIASAWAMARKEHVTLDVLTQRFSKRTNALLDLVLYVCVGLPVLFVLFVKGLGFAYTSFMLKEKVPSPPYLPIYPLKFSIPLGILLLILQTLANLIRTIEDLRSTRSE